MIFKQVDDILSGRNGCYLLGVVHGDGHVSERSVAIAVDGRLPEYAEILSSLWQELGFSAKTYTTKRGVLSVQVHSKELADTLRLFKTVDHWAFPGLPVYPCDYIAGLVDTDGHVGRGTSGDRRAISITQKSGDKLPRIRPILDAAGFQHVPIVTRANHKVRGEPYPVDEIWWRSREDVIQFANSIPLRHPPKAERIKKCVELISHLQRKAKDEHRVRILHFLREHGGATLPEIAEAVGLSRKQTLLALNGLRRFANVHRNDPPIDSLVWTATDKE